MSDTICIGVPTYKRPRHLEDLLGRLVPLLESRPHIRLCIANDGSHDTAYEKAIAPYIGRIDYRILLENGGCGAARRACFEGAMEDYLVCIDDDCVPTKAWLDWLESLIEANPGIDLFAGDVRPYFVGAPGLLARTLSMLDEAPSPLVGRYGLLTAVTANLAMKRAAYEAAGGFATDLRGTEDCAITQSLLEAGATYLISLDWMIEHVAKTDYFGIRGRFRSYGLHGAYFVVNRQSWRLGALQSGGSFREILTTLRTKLSDELSSAASRKRRPIERRLRAVVLTLLTLEYSLGWRAGLRKHGVKTRADLPRHPSLADSYVDFTGSDAAALSLP